MATAVVIGGTRRVGRWVSEALLVAGHRTYAVFRSDQAAADEAAEQLAAGGYTLHLRQMDATDEQGISSVIESIAVAEGGIGLLVNCAGPSICGRIGEVDAKQFEALWRGNVLAVHNATRAAVRFLSVNEGGGRIINFLSAGSETQRSFSSIPLYAACKAMLASYSRSLARELAGQGVTVNCISLGVTNLVAEGAPGYEADQLPSGQYVTQDDVAAAIWYLSGPASGQTTGSVLNLAGGFGL
jgi:NAD(P)-dependent dehydrogenase (short-subunit alcohol dehydrogenase family)